MPQGTDESPIAPEPTPPGEPAGSATHYWQASSHPKSRRLAFWFGV